MHKRNHEKILVLLIFQMLLPMPTTLPKRWRVKSPLKSEGNACLPSFLRLFQSVYLDMPAAEFEAVKRELMKNFIAEHTKYG